MASEEKRNKLIKEFLDESKRKIISRTKEKTSDPLDSKKATIGEHLIFEMLESKKVVLEKIEISKQAMDNLQKQSKLKNIPVEQIIANLIEKNFNPKFQK